jgi:site-specific recombinase XerD
MANAGMDLKSLQYLMGHSDAGVTMNVYTHASYAHAEQTMQKILKFDPQKEQKTG